MWAVGEEESLGPSLGGLQVQILSLGVLKEHSSKFNQSQGENAFSRLDCSWPTLLDPITVGKTTCQAKPPERAGRSQRGQLHNKEECVYPAEEFAL